MGTKRLGVLILAALLVGGCGVATESEEPGSRAEQSLPGLTPEKLEKLRAAAIKGAAEMGEEHPTDGVVISTTQHHFFDVTDGATFGTPDFDAYVVAYRGDFVADMASRPSGVSAPRGHAVYVVYDAKTLSATDWGVGDLPVEPNKIGPWIPLDLG